MARLGLRIFVYAAESPAAPLPFRHVAHILNPDATWRPETCFGESDAVARTKAQREVDRLEKEASMPPPAAVDPNDPAVQKAEAARVAKLQNLAKGREKQAAIRKGEKVDDGKETAAAQE